MPGVTEEVYRSGGGAQDEVGLGNGGGPNFRLSSPSPSRGAKRMLVSNLGVTAQPRPLLKALSQSPGLESLRHLIATVGR